MISCNILHLKSPKFYIISFPFIKCKSKKYLFEKAPGIKNSPKSISRILERIKNSLNLDTLSAHKFRHTFATALYEMTNDIEYTRVLLGHHDTTMTKRYIHHSTKKNKERYDELNIKIKENKKD